MSTERAEQTGLLDRLRRFFVGEEEASAMAEMVILIPLYLVILYGLIFFGQGMLIRQQATEAARFLAFNPPGRSVGDMAGFFDDRFDGQLIGAQRVPPRDVTFETTDVRNALETESEGRHADRIARILNNDGDSLIEAHGAVVAWRYSANWAAFAGVPNDTDVRAELSLYHLKGNRRPVWEQGQDHPIMEHQSDGLTFEAEEYEEKLPNDLRDSRGKGPWDIGWRPEKGGAGKAYYEKYRGRSDQSGSHPLGF